MADNRPTLQQYARQLETELGLPTGIADTLVKAESGGNPYAVSPKGAIGLTQLMPDTAKELGVNPNDPYDNLKGGLTYYAKHYNKFNQNPVLAAAAYNAGPNSIGLKSRDTTKLPQETQDYMSKFTGYLNKPVKTSLSQEEAIALGLEEAPQPKQLSHEEAVNLGLEQPTGKELSPSEAIALGLEEPRTLTGALKESAGNIPSSIGKTAIDTAKAIIHPIDTAGSIKDIAAGEILKLVPKSTLEKSLKYAQMEPTGDPIKDKAIEQAKEVVKAYNTATMFNENLANRYGGKQEILNTLATDPAGLLLDLAPVGTGAIRGATAGAKMAGEIIGKTPKGMAELVNKQLATAGAGPMASINNIPGVAAFSSKGKVNLGPELTAKLAEQAAAMKSAEYMANVNKVLNPIQRTGEIISNIPSEAASFAFNKVLAPPTKGLISKWSGIPSADISAAFESGKLGGQALPVPMSDISSPFNKIAPQLDFSKTPVKSAIVGGELLTGNIPAAVASLAGASPRTVGITAKTLGGLYNIPENINAVKKAIQPYRGTINAVERLNQQVEENPSVLNNIPNIPNSPLDKLAGVANIAMGIAPNQYDNADIFNYGVTPTAQQMASNELAMYALGLNKSTGRPGLFNPPKAPNIQGPGIGPVDYSQYKTPAYNRPTTRFTNARQADIDAKNAAAASKQAEIDAKLKQESIANKAEADKQAEIDSARKLLEKFNNMDASNPSVKMLIDKAQEKLDTLTGKPKGLLTPKEDVVNDEDYYDNYFGNILAAEEAAITPPVITPNVKKPDLGINVGEMSSKDTKAEDILALIRSRGNPTPEEQLFANLEPTVPVTTAEENAGITSGLLSRKPSKFDELRAKIKHSQENMPIAPEDAAAYDKWMVAHENRSAGQQLRRQIDSDAKQYTYITSKNKIKTVDTGLLSDLEKAYNTTFDYSTMPNINKMGLKDARRTIKKWAVNQIKSTGGVKNPQGIQGGLLGDKQ